MKQFRFLLLIAFSSSFAFGGIVDQLKKAPEKTGKHSMRNIDFVYMINLDRRAEKFKMSCDQLAPYGIHPFRFSAVNGWELSLEAVNDVGLKFQSWMTPLMATTFRPEAHHEQSHEFMTEVGRAYFAHCLSRGAIGCALSHISILKDAYDSGYETIWVMEDDIEIIQNPLLLADIIDELDRIIGKNKWDVLFTDRDYRSGVGQYVESSGSRKRPDLDCRYEERMSSKYTQKTVMSQNLKKIGSRFGTHSMIIRRSGIKKLLDFAIQHQIFLPYDLENYLAPNLQRYGVRYDIVSNLLNSISDNGGANYEE